MEDNKLLYSVFNTDKEYGMENTKMECVVDKLINNMEFKGTVIYDKETGSFDFTDVKVLNSSGNEICPFYIVETNCVKYNSASLSVTIKQALKWRVLYELGFNDGLTSIDYPSMIVSDENVRYLNNGDGAWYELTAYFDKTDEFYLREDCHYIRVRRDDGYIKEIFAPRQWYEELPFCEECQCYVMDSENYNYERGCCHWCRGHIIEGYSESHRHNDNPKFFGKYKGTFAGFGFELEVDSREPDMREVAVDTAENLISNCGLEEGELRYAHDGSLNYGFEIISEPHTVEDFWAKTPKWEKMLKYLLEQGFRSHDPNTCGLHIHISREFLGKTKSLQDSAISKIYTFFDDNWRDLVKVSRRTQFDYCDKNALDYCDYEKIRRGNSTKYKEWKKRSKNCGSHYVALNNRNPHTFEYRLGRGTLNAWSFFSWIDLILTISKNAKRITVGKVESNDAISWLGGITESTARYIYKRGAFKDTVLSLYPSIAWSNDNSDNSSDND